jgi:dihydrofolate reductase
MQPMLLSIIVAASDNNVIGQGNWLPWDLPDELQYFRDMTAGKPVIMGRNTFESIMNHLGRPMPGRHNIVVTSKADYAVPEGVSVVSSLAEGIFRAEEDQPEEAFIIGGGKIYEEAIDLPDIDYLYLTRVHTELPVTEDTVFFPEYDEKKWECSYCEDHPADERHQYAFTMCLYRRKKKEYDD